VAVRTPGGTDCVDDLTHRERQGDAERLLEHEAITNTLAGCGLDRPARRVGHGWQPRVAFVRRPRRERVLRRLVRIAYLYYYVSTLEA
jgi:hypothetical protein